MTVGRIEFGPVSGGAGRKDDLAELLKRSLASFEALSPVDKAFHRAEQRRSMIRGIAGQDPGPNVLVEEIKRLRALVVSLGGNPHA